MQIVGSSNHNTCQLLVQVTNVFTYLLHLCCPYKDAKFVTGHALVVDVIIGSERKYRQQMTHTRFQPH